MKTRKKEPDAPGAATPWDEVAPGLWMGGHFWNGPAGDGQSAVAGSEFDLVVSLFTRPGHELGWETATAIALVREKRSPWALHNKLFVDYLTTGLETAALLAELDPAG